MAALRSGWYLGDETFRDQLLGLVKKGSHAPASIKRHGEGEAEKIMVREMSELGLSDEEGQPSPELIQFRPEGFDQSRAWQPEEIPLGDGRTLVLDPT